MVERTITTEPHLPTVEERFDGLPHYHFPEHPQEVEYDGKVGWMYIPEGQMHGLLDQLSERLPLQRADKIIVFMNGGEWTFIQLCRRQGFDPNDARVRQVKTTRQNGGDRVIVENPEILSDISPNEIVVGIEDLVDKDGTGKAVQNHVPQIRIFAPVAKRKISTPIPNHVTVMATIDHDKWIGGIGSDYGPYAEQMYGYAKDYPRQCAAIIVMPESLHDSSIS